MLEGIREPDRDSKQKTPISRATSTLRRGDNKQYILCSVLNCMLAGDKCMGQENQGDSMMKIRKLVWGTGCSCVEWPGGPVEDASEHVQVWRGERMGHVSVSGKSAPSCRDTPHQGLPRLRDSLGAAETRAG